MRWIVVFFQFDYLMLFYFIITEVPKKHNINGFPKHSPKGFGMVSPTYQTRSHGHISAALVHVKLCSVVVGGGVGLIYICI